MSYRGALHYGNDYQFTGQELAPITPTQLVQWMSLKVYGIPNPSPDDNPTKGRSSSLEYYKKAISSFMPHRLQPWNSLTNFGNPTRSVEVNDLIKRVKKKEVRRQGKESQARRALEPEEFEQLIELIEENPDERRYLMSALNRFQFHMIARIDDTAKFYVEDLKANSQFDFTILAKMCWSKNVQDERDAPDQIVIGAMDRRYCAHIGFAVHLETWIESGDGATNKFVFGFDGNEDPIHNKATAKHFIKAHVFDNPAFNIRSPGKIGTHSTRKYAATYARRNGCGRDDTDSRGRWKKRVRQVDTYIEPTLPYPDAKVAAVLCRGGACKYVMKEGSGISDAWILEYVVPHIAMRFSGSVALVLGRALLWVAFEDFGVYLPQGLRNRIQTAYADIPGQQLEPGENPVKKVLLVVSGNEGEVYIDALDDEDDENDGDGPPRRRRRHERDELLGLHSQMASLRQENVQLKDQMTRESNRSDQQFANLARMMRRLLGQAARPIRNVRTGEVTAGNEEAPAAQNLVAPLAAATLSVLPRTVHTLWIEYEFGIGGRKPAKDFTPTERGKAKYNYHRRKVVWDVIAALVRGGWLSDVACDRIYEVYGRQQSVTTIINNMRKDRITYNGHAHPALRIANL
jgi:hypothetical protein